jgi:hypothetical protein
MMRKRPKLIDVRLIPWEMNGDIYGVACEYDDGVTTREMWGGYGEAVVAVSLRQLDIAAEVKNLKQA